MISNNSFHSKALGGTIFGLNRVIDTEYNLFFYEFENRLCGREQFIE